MEKGAFGFKLSTYAVLAFVLAFLGQTTLLALLLGFVIVTEKNEWLTRQTMQAFFLTIGLSVLGGALDMVYQLFSWIPSFGFISISAIVSTLFDWIEWGVDVAALVFIILALFKVMKGGEAKIPLVATFANKAYGIAKKAPAMPQYPQYPQQPQNPQYPQYPQQ